MLHTPVTIDFLDRIRRSQFESESLLFLLLSFVSANHDSMMMMMMMLPFQEFENLTRDSKQTSASYEGQLTQNATIMQDMQSTIENLTEQLKSFDITHPLTVKSSQVSHYV